MHEKDIELTRLLLTRQHEIAVRAGDLSQRHAQARADLEDTLESIRQRDIFEGVLAQAADLLERPDLQVEQPDLAEKESLLESLAGELQSIQVDNDKVSKLVNELRDKAPDLVAAAEAAVSVARVTGNPPESSQPSTYGHTMPPESAAAAAHVPAPEPAADETDVDGLPALRFNDDEAQRLLRAYKLRDIRRNDDFAQGHGCVFIVDTQSIFESVESYGYTSEVTDQNSINNQLAQEYLALSTMVNGSFHLIFNGNFVPEYNYSSRIAADFVEGGEPVAKEDLYGRILHLVEKYSGMLKKVCTITADEELAELVTSKGALSIPLNKLYA